MRHSRESLFLLLGIVVAAAVLLLLDLVDTDFAEHRQCQEWSMPSEIDHLAIHRGGSRLGLVRQSGRWILTSPYSAPIEQKAVERLVDVISSLRPYDEIPDAELFRREIGKRQLGLGENATEISVEGNGRRCRFKMGFRSPQGDAVYAALPEKATTFLMPRVLADVVPHDADDLRLRRILPALRDDIWAFEVREPNRPFVRVERTADGWRLMQPQAALADDAVVGMMLSALETNRVSSFSWPLAESLPSTPGEAESRLAGIKVRSGLSEETGMMVRVFVEGEPAPQTLLFGAAAERDQVWMLTPDGGCVAAVPAAVPAAFADAGERLCDSRICPLRLSDVEGVSISRGASELSLVRAETGWRLGGSAVGSADEMTVRSFIEEMLALRGVRAAETNDFARGSSVVLRSAGRTTTISFSQPTNGLSSVQVLETGTRARVPATSLPQALVSERGLLSFHDRTVLSLASAAIRRISAHVSGSETREIDFPIAGEAFKRFEAFLSLIANLRADGVEKLVVSLEDLELYGFREPYAEITFDVTTDDAVRKTLLIGAPNGMGHRSATVRGSDAVFVLSDETVESLVSPFVTGMER